MSHRAELSKSLGWELHPAEASADLVTHSSPRLLRAFSRLRKKILSRLRPYTLSAGPPPGQWRKNRPEPGHQNNLFQSILVSLGGSPSGWKAFEQALIVARRENARIRGLHIVSHKSRPNDEVILAIQTEFYRRCEPANVQGEFVLDVGNIARQISRRAHWHDLLAINLIHPPADDLAGRMRSGIRELVQTIHTPILTVPAVSDMSRAFLAYVGCPK